MSIRQEVAVEVRVPVSVDLAWKGFTDPEAIIKWNFASDDWCCPKAANDLRVGGSFNYRMEAKNGAAGFDFSGMYTEVEYGRLIAYEMGDGRKVSIEFLQANGNTRVSEIFEAENQNSLELQRTGWQAILDNYAKYVVNR